MADFFNKIVYMDSTGEEITLDQSTSVATVDESTLSVAEAQHAVNADHATNADNATNANHATNADSATKATQDGNGQNIASTYATQSALTSGLNGKADKSGTFPDLVVGEATTARSLNTQSGEAGFSLVTVICNKWTFAGIAQKGQVAFGFICRTSNLNHVLGTGKTLAQLVSGMHSAGVYGRFLTSGQLGGQPPLYINVPQSGNAILYMPNSSGNSHTSNPIQNGAYAAEILYTSHWDF